MPRTDREDSRSALMEELMRCGFTSDQAYREALRFTDDRITAGDVRRTRRLIAEVRQKFEAYGQRFQKELEAEKQMMRKVIEAIKDLASEAETFEKRDSFIFSPQQLAQLTEEVDRQMRNGAHEPTSKVG